MTTPERYRRPCLPSRSTDPGSWRWTTVLASALLVFVFPLLAAILCAPVLAQKPKPYALIYGTVFSADGRVVYGVPVKVRRADKKKTLMDATSDHSGEFAFRVPPGPADYIVWADLKPPKKKPAEAAPPATAQTQSGMELKVHVDAEERVDISLHLPEALKPY